MASPLRINFSGHEHYSSLHEASLPPMKLLEQELERRACHKLHEYTKRAWPHAEPGKEFVDNWHIHAICDHLEAVTAGHIQNLLINIPPRHSKSLLVGVFWPTWEWGPKNRPGEQYLTASYASVLSIRDAVKSRRLLQSPWYQSLWGHVFQMAGDQNAKTRYDNNKNGYRIATSVDGTATGEGGSRIIVDDPHNAKNAQSEVIRENDILWWRETMSTRLNNPRSDSRVVVMQRLNEGDLSGYILGSGDEWVHLMLPAEYEPRRKCIVFLDGKKFFEDPRQEKGDLIYPERFDRKEVDRLKRELGEYGTAGQLQQRPDPVGGGIINTGRFKLWPSEAELPELQYILQSYDTATSEKTVNDPTAFLAFGVFFRKGRYQAIILDAWEEHLKYPALRRRVKNQYSERYGDFDEDDPTNPGYAVNAVLVEDKSSGPAVRQDLQTAGVPIIPYNPGKVDKVQRATDVAPLVDIGLIWVLEDDVERGKPVEWVRKCIKDLKMFPTGNDDHYVDAFTQGIRYLRDASYLRVDKEAEPEEVDYNSQKLKPNPYAS